MISLKSDPLSLMHRCASYVEHVLVWGQDIEKVKYVRNHLMDEFSEHIYAFDLDSVPSLAQLEDIELIEEKVNEYDFHVIKVFENHMQLVFVDNIVENEEVNDFEEAIENLGRRISQYKLRRFKKLTPR